MPWERRVGDEADLPGRNRAGPGMSKRHDRATLRLMNKVVRSAKLDASMSGCVQALSGISASSVAASFAAPQQG